MSDSAINFGIVGCGRIAQRHALHINNNGRLVATYDIKPEKSEALASEYGAKAFPSYESFLEEKFSVQDKKQYRKQKRGNAESVQIEYELCELRSKRV